MGMQGGETAAAQYPLACLEDIPISRLPALVKAHDKLGAALNAASPHLPPHPIADDREFGIVADKVRDLGVRLGGFWKT